jgi:hypothetical protein
VTIRSTLVAAALAALLASHPALAEVRGMVYELANPTARRDEWQRKPLAGAYVVISWSITIPAPAHATSTCRHSEIARSNDKGEYVMEGPGLVTEGLARTSWFVYAPGMDRVDWPWAERPEALKDISMAKSTLSPDERLSRLANFGYPGCHSREIHDPRGVLKAYHEALAAEARAFSPNTTAGRSILQSLESRAKNFGIPPTPDGTVLRIEAAPVDRGSLLQRDTPRPEPSSR